MDRTVFDSESVELMRKAEADGRQWALALKPGDRFTGASMAASLAGYPSRLLQHTIFVHGALNILDQMDLYTDNDGIIVRLERKQSKETV